MIAKNRDYIWLGGIPIANVDTTGGTSTITYVTADELGTPRAIADSSGNTIWQRAYQGNPWNEVAPTSNGYVYNLGFSGQYFDAETGQFSNGPRYYDSGRGGYDQPDPIGQRGGLGLYVYSDNNPLLYADPSGLSWKDAIALTYEWATGTGPLHQDFGPNTSEAAEMANAPGVLAAEALYRKKNAQKIKSHCPGSSFEPVTNYAARFGLKGLVESGLNPTEQFIGSYRIDIYPSGDDQMDVVINNTSSFQSFAYGLGPDWDRSTFGPMGNMSQTIHVTANDQ